jgi:hypothetical protein
MNADASSGDGPTNSSGATNKLILSSLKNGPLREDINRVQSNVTYDFVYVDEESFEKYKPTSFRQLVDGFREYKEKI